MVMIFSILVICLVVLEAESACRFTNGQYKLSWVVDRSQNVHFHLDYYNFPPVNAWTGVAFGQSMGSGLDAILIKVINGRVTVTDEYVRGYGPSFPDRYQDVQVQNAGFRNGVLKVTFVKPILGSEPIADKSLSGCTPWQFITAPGTIHDQYGRIGMHSRRPTTQIVCLDQCRI